MRTADSWSGYRVAEVLEVIIAASNCVVFEHTLQSKDAEIVGSATLFQRAALRFLAKNCAPKSCAITMVRTLKPRGLLHGVNSELWKREGHSTGGNTDEKPPCLRHYSFMNRL